MPKKATTRRAHAKHRYSLETTGSPPVTVAHLHGSKDLAMLRLAITSDRERDEGSIYEIHQPKELRRITRDRDAWTRRLVEMIGGRDAAATLVATLDKVRDSGRDLVLRIHGSHELPAGPVVAADVPRDWVPIGPPKPDPWVASWQRIARAAHEKARLRHNPILILELQSQTRRNRTYDVYGDLSHPETFGCSCPGWQGHARCKDMTSVCEALGIGVPATASTYLPQELRDRYHQQAQEDLDAHAAADGRFDARFGLAYEPEAYSPSGPRSAYRRAYDSR